MAVFHSVADAARGRSIWHPDIVPEGLDASSYQRGDGVGSWSYPSNETGAVGESDFGLDNGTLIQPFVWKTCPSGEFSVTTYLKIDTDNVFARTGGIVLGNNLSGASTSATYYTWKIELDGNIPNLVFQRYANGSYQNNLITIGDFQPASGWYLRVGVNSGQTSANAWASIDGVSWLLLGTPAVNLFTLNQVGITFPTNNRNNQYPWFRIRTGAGEFDNWEPEGGLT